MAIEIHPTDGAFTPSDDQARRDNQKSHTNFNATDLGNGGGAATGSMDFLRFTSRLGLTRIDPTVEPYLEKVQELIKNNLPNISMVRMERVPGAYAFRFNGPDSVANFFAVLFVPSNEPTSQDFRPASQRIQIITQEIKERFPDERTRLVDARVLVSGYQPDLDRFYEMADKVVRTFQVTCIPELRDAKINSLAGNEFVVDWNLSNARQAERSLSPHGVAPRMDVGLTISAKIKNEYGRDFQQMDEQFRLLGVIGGYTEFREREPVNVNGVVQLRYQPVFNITVCDSIVPLEGVAAILMAALAPTIYNSKFWAKQWRDLGRESPQPGFLDENPDNRGNPVMLSTEEDLLDWINNHTAQPVIAYQFEDGRDNIPNLWHLTSTTPNVRKHFLDRINNFFDTPEDNTTTFNLGVPVETRFDGLYGSVEGGLHDSRNIDYLHIAAKNGYGSINLDMRRVLLGNAQNATERPRIVSAVTNSFKPLYLNNIVLLNPAFIEMIIGKAAARRLVIVDPNGQAEVRPIGSFITGFGSATGIGSIVSNGVVNRGGQIGSVYSYF